MVIHDTECLHLDQVTLPLLAMKTHLEFHVFFLVNLAIGIFKMFSHWILGIFNVQIQSTRGTNSCTLLYVS